MFYDRDPQLDNALKHASLAITVLGAKTFKQRTGKWNYMFEFS